MNHPRAVVVSLALAAAAYLGSFSLVVEGQGGATEAPAGFDNQTNGFLSPADFAAAKTTFEERDEIADGLGPVYNAQACSECHQNPVTGAISQISELRAGHQDANGNFVDAPGGSLINDRATDASIQERVPGAEDVRTFRMSTNTLGNGFVEAINSNTIVALANAQPGQSGGRIAGQVIQVPVNEAPGNIRVGRFGWKNQHASLLSFSGDAYLNEIGITNRLNATENTSMGRSVAIFDPIPEVGGANEDPENDIDEFAAFMRATKVPPRDTAPPDVRRHRRINVRFDGPQCHTRTITTAAWHPSTAAAHHAEMRSATSYPSVQRLPLHDIGTGDGIVRTGPGTHEASHQPLWGVRTNAATCTTAPR